MSTLSESALREQVIAKLTSNELPIAAEHKIFAGYGHNEVCDCCDLPIQQRDVLYEVEVQQERSEPIVLAMHRLCFNVWLEETHRRRASQEPQHRGNGAMPEEPSR